MFKDIMKSGITIKSSGTTGTPKEIFQSPQKLKYANRVAVYAQEITADSSVYTVCKMAHAGGLLAQTLPAYSVGADVVIEDFSAYRWCKEIHKYTHSHLTPNHCRAIIKTKRFSELELNGVWITCGSDMVTWDIIEKFVSKGCTFMCNWGMTEIGPITINTVFKTMEDVETYKFASIQKHSLLGDRFFCRHKIQDGELWVKGELCVYDDWYPTKDVVAMNDYGHMYYHGRL
jgi:acyl-coenzyme A synthetase/AMP-(fatty) acid ligase